MKFFGFDTETNLIIPGKHAPELACFQWQTDPGKPQLDTADDGADQFAHRLTEGVLIVGHNVSYDLAVMGVHRPEILPAIFQALNENRITCTMVRAQLADIEHGVYRGRMGEDDKWIEHTYHLDAIARRYTGRVLSKEVKIRVPHACLGAFLGKPETYGQPLLDLVNTKKSDGSSGLGYKARWEISEGQIVGLEINVRLSYGFLKQIPIEQWPPEAVAYALEDATATLETAEAQGDGPVSPDEYNQVRNQFWKHLMSCWGLRTRLAGVEALRVATQRDRDVLQDRLVQAGLVRSDGSRDTKLAAKRMIDVCTAEDLPIRRTKTYDPEKHGKDECISLDEDACKAAGDPLLLDYATFTSLGTILNKDVAALIQGVRTPVQSRFDMAESGRSTSSGPNVQNWSSQ